MYKASIVKFLDNHWLTYTNSIIHIILFLHQLKEENEKLRRDLKACNQAREEERKRWCNMYICIYSFAINKLV